MTWQLATIKTRFDELLAIRAPGKVGNWHPNAALRERYLDVLNSLLDLAESVRKSDEMKLHDRTVQECDDDGLLGFYKNEFRPRLPQLKDAQRRLDPAAAPARAAEQKRRLARQRRPVRMTFEMALGEMLALQEPEIRIAYMEKGKPDTAITMEPELALDVCYSVLFDFDPDAWLERVRDINVIRTVKGKAQLPKQIEDRLTELYRSYVYGNWSAVLALARSVLEFAILDNAKRFRITLHTPHYRYPNRIVRKRLAQLCDETLQMINAAGNARRITDSLEFDMEFLREEGNAQLHGLRAAARKGATRFNAALPLSDKAREAIDRLRATLETLYSAKA